jgi:hypothetical protein
MRYLVRARVKPGCEPRLLKAIEDGTLGQGSVAGGEYLRNMQAARLCEDKTTRWVEICYCPTPLQEEREYWEQYFELTRVQDAHDRSRCRDQNGSEPWACSNCDCTERLERKLETTGKPFLESLRQALITLPPPVSADERPATDRRSRK